MASNQARFTDSSDDENYERINVSQVIESNNIKQGDKVRALYTFDATEDGQMQLHQDEVVTVTKGDDLGWLEAKKSNGEAGFIPTQYVEKAATISAVKSGGEAAKVPAQNVARKSTGGAQFRPPPPVPAKPENSSQVGASKKAPVAKKWSWKGGDEEWRKVNDNDWNKKGLKKIKNDIMNIKFPPEANMKAANILVVGQIGGGKSSLLNTIATAYSKVVVTHKADAATDETSATKKLRCISIKDEKNNEELKVKFYDTMGLESEDTGVKTETLKYVLDGHIKKDGDLENFDAEKFRQNPELKHRMHGIVYLIHGNNFGLMDETAIDKIKNIWKYARGQDPPIPSIVILSAIDVACPLVAKKTSKVFQSEEIKEVVNNVSKVMGIPPNRIYPQRNYCDQQVKDIEVDYLTAINVKQILTMAREYCLKIVEQKEDSDSD